MGILNFPVNPTLGQSHTIGVKTYVWNGQAWILGPVPGNFTTITGTNLTITTTTNATSLSTGGALTVLGGASIAGDLILGGSLIGISTGTGGGVGAITGGTATFAKIFATGGIQATSTNTGDVVVTGGVGIGGNLWIGGTLFSAGSPVLTTASFNNSLQDGVDIDIVDVGGGILEFNDISTLQSVTTRGNSTTNQIFVNNLTESTSTYSGAVVISGGIGIGGRVTSESVRIMDTIFDSTVRTVNSVVPTVIDEFSFGDYRSAKYLVQIDEGTSSTQRCQITELLTLVSNTGSVIVTEYGSVVTETDLGNFDAMTTVVGAETFVRLFFIAVDTVPKTVKVMRTAMAK